MLASFVSSHGTRNFVADADQWAELRSATYHRGALFLNTFIYLFNLVLAVRTLEHWDFFVLIANSCFFVK